MPLILSVILIFLTGCVSHKPTSAEPQRVPNQETLPTVKIAGCEGFGAFSADMELNKEGGIYYWGQSGDSEMVKAIGETVIKEKSGDVTYLQFSTGETSSLDHPELNYPEKYASLKNKIRYDKSVWVPKAYFEGKSLPAKDILLRFTLPTQVIPVGNPEKLSKVECAKTPSGKKCIRNLHQFAMYCVSM